MTIDRQNGNKQGVSDWKVVTALVMFILLKGLFSFLAVGDLGQPGWDYRPVADVPGASPYAVYEPLPHPQHIKGASGE